MIRPIVLAMLALPSMAMAASVPTTAPPPAVTIIRAVLGEIAETVLVTGSLAARDEILINPRIDSQAITEILADEGDHVEKGQILARLQRDTLEANLAQFTAQIARADASAIQAQAQIAQMRAVRIQAAELLARGRALLPSGTTSRETIEQREANAQVAVAQEAAAVGALASAQADRALAEAQRNEVQARIDRADIRAPVAGIVSRRTARIGAVSGMTGEPLFRLIAEGALELDANVPETTLARLRVGQPATIEITGHPDPRTGQIRLIAPEVAPTTRLGRVRITVHDATGLALGGFARARVEIARSTGVLVPLSAVVTRPGGAELQVVTGTIVETRHVHIGLHDGKSAEILDNLSPGEAVIAISGTFVRNGDRVTPVAAR